MCIRDRDTDGRLVFTSALREYFAENPKEMDLKKYLDYARNEMKNFYIKKINSVFKTK